ncbi:MAG: Holliday junction resolvase RuvX [Brevinematia bacterium]
MRILALDVGKKNVGIAFCDTEIGIVFPRKAIVVKSTDKALEEIKNIVGKDKVDKIVVGLPLNFNSSRSHIQEFVEEFTQKLKEKISVDIEFFDERFTTKIASLFSSENIDSISAKILLEDYIKSKKL